ncbi:MAG: hypothetical protein L0211_22765 [Planctomycetaceae bacterium]|nr:hypothetical protein [Planctomycetaceae bacterium]
MNRSLTWLASVSLAALLTAAGSATSQEPAGTTDARAAHLARMKALASTFEVFATPGKPESKVELAAQPVLRYADNTRQTLESSLWIWGAEGRPTAVMAIEFYPNGQRVPRWLYEVASLSTGLIAAQRGEDLKWTAKQPGLVLQTLADADSPASRPAVRLAQMKSLRARFTAYEHAVIEGRIELRPLTSPLHRYADTDSGILDGAIFSFANGTNPEVLLALEAHQSAEKATWVYGLAQMTGGAIAVQLDGKDVWERGAAEPPAVRDSYVNGWIASDSPTE